MLYINNYYTVNISGNMLRAALEQLLISIELEKIIMIDVAQNLMSLGESIAAAHTTSVNDNMIRSHYHDYYELYF